LYIRRGYKRGSLTQKRSLIKISVEGKKILEILREEGPCSYKELRQRTKIARGTLDRRLQMLKTLGLIVSGKRKWMAIEYVKKYENLEEYKINLAHSKEVLNGLLAIYHFVPQVYPFSDPLTRRQRKELDLNVTPELWPYAFQHLKTGYPTVYKIFEQLYTVLEEVRTIQNGQMTAFLETLEIENFSRISRESTPENTKLEERLKELEEKSFEIMNELEDQIMKIVFKVLNGEPLNGTCSLCPAVKIKKDQTQ